MTTVLPPKPSLATLPFRLRRYQQERLPLWKGALMAGAISFSAVTFPAQLAHREPPSIFIYMLAFFIVGIFQFQRRIADDLRNLQHDRRTEPDRPIPRGLVSPNELRLLFLALVPIQAILCGLIDVRMWGLLLVATGFLMLLTLGVGPLRWNRLHPLFYLFFHRLAAPLTLYVASAAEWMPRNGSPPFALILLLLVSYSNSFILEIGRNFRLPAESDPDARSYAVLWGPRRASLIWWMLINLAAIFSTVARTIRHAPPQGVAVLLVAVLIAGIFAYRFAADPESRGAKRFDLLSVLWTTTLFLTVVIR